MRNVTFRRMMWVVLWSSLLTATTGALAQDRFEALPAGAQVRDAALDTTRGLVYLADYDRSTVRQVTLAGNETLATASVGAGPAALALSHDGGLLACVNRLSNDACLISTADMRVVATVPCGKGAGAVTALPGGGFVVVNSFDDSLTLIAPERPESPATVANVSSVPNAVAASDRMLAVAVKAPAALLFFEAGADVPVARVPLDAAPVALAALDSGRFGVATDRELLVADPQGIRARIALADPALDMTFDGRRLAVLMAGRVTLFSTDLEAAGDETLPVEASAIAAADSILVALSPRSMRWLRRGATAVAPTLPQTADTIAPEPTPLPAPAPEVAPAPVAPPPRVEEAESIELSPEPEPEPRPEASPEPAPSPEPEPAAETIAGDSAADTAAVEASPEPSENEPVRIAGAPAPHPPIPPHALQTRAHHFTRSRPPAAPTLSAIGGSLSDALSQSAGLVEREGGFMLPERLDSFMDVSAERLQITEASQLWTWEGNVGWRLEDTQFAMDKLSIDRRTNEFAASGNVQIRQELASIDADRLYYRIPTGAEPEVAPLVVSADLDEDERARRVLSLGRLQAENIHILEPGRELHADHIDYDLATRVGELSNARGHTGVFYFGAAKLRMLGPASADGEEVWVTTCDHDPPHYRIRVKRAALEEGDVIVGRDAQLEIGPVPTPIYWPKWSFHPMRKTPISVDFDSGRSANIGYYFNFGQRFAVSKDVDLGLRLFPTTKQGIGLGLEGEYDFMQNPSSPLFRSRGEFHTLYTTKDSGYAEMYHRQELREDTVLQVRAEQWFDRDFVKDFYYNEYRTRTEPRTFAHVAHTQPTYMATATVRPSTHGWTNETERLPEVTYHLFERPLADRLYFTFDTITGYNERDPGGPHAARTVNVGRLSLDLSSPSAFSITPFWETDLSWYSHDFDGDDSSTRWANTVGANLQTRFHRAYPGGFGFSGFKHVIVPSITYSYRPEPTMGVEETPRFDAYDNVYGRSRIESKIANILIGQDAVTGESWQVARLTLYQGNDFASEIRKSDDYELELDVRPRPWWGMLMAAEQHNTSKELTFDQPFVAQRLGLELYERVFRRQADPELLYRYSAVYGDYERVLSYLYYDDFALKGRFSGRVGFAYTKTQDRVFNREILYGMSYKVAERWALAFEHRYDLERDDLYHQEYELRRNLHCWDATLQIRDRESGWDFGFEMSLTAFPTTKVKF